jgi:apolipoprotein N-acyltransferase
MRLKRFFPSLVSGLLLGFAYPSYPEFPTGLLAWFAFVPILVNTSRIKDLKTYFLMTIPVFLISGSLDFWWTALFSWKALLVCLTTQIWGVYLPLFLHYFVKRRYGWRISLILLPFYWTLIDWLTHQLPHTLQVNNIAYTQANNIWLIQFSDLTGMWGITFSLISVNCLIAHAISFEDKLIFKWMRLVPVLLIFGGMLTYSFWVYKVKPSVVLGNERNTTKVAIVQTNIDSYSTDSTKESNVFNEIVQMSDSIVRRNKPDLIVLPEGAVALPLFQNKSLLDFTKKAIASWQTSVAIGFVEYPDTIKRNIFKNNALVFTPQLATYWDSLKVKPEDVKVYQKEYGLPFVELMPYCDDCQTLTGVQMQKGKDTWVFQYKNEEGEISKVALTICWEQMYPQKLASLVGEGAEFIALMNNDAWFGTSAGAKQLQSFTRMRAIENRRSVVRCSNGGISCFIDPYGQISNKLPWFTTAVGIQEILKVSKNSFYTVHPLSFLKLIFVLLFLLLMYFEILNQKIKN